MSSVRVLNIKETRKSRGGLSPTSPLCGRGDQALTAGADYSTNLFLVN